VLARANQIPSRLTKHAPDRPVWAIFHAVSPRTASQSTKSLLGGRRVMQAVGRHLPLDGNRTVWCLVLPRLGSAVSSHRRSPALPNARPAVAPPLRGLATRYGRAGRSASLIPLGRRSPAISRILCPPPLASVAYARAAGLHSFHSVQPPAARALPRLAAPSHPNRRCAQHPLQPTALSVRFSTSSCADCSWRLTSASSSGGRLSFSVGPLLYHATPLGTPLPTSWLTVDKLARRA
jgi:hypothetical protein